MGDDFSCARLIFGEADQFPGLTVDLFGDILVTEVLSLGMEVRKSLLYSLLVELLAGYGVGRDVAVGNAAGHPDDAFAGVAALAVADDANGRVDSAVQYRELAGFIHDYTLKYIS